MLGLKLIHVSKRDPWMFTEFVLDIDLQGVSDDKPALV